MTVWFHQKEILSFSKMYNRAYFCDFFSPASTSSPQMTVEILLIKSEKRALATVRFHRVECLFKCKTKHLGLIQTEYTTRMAKAASPCYGGLKSTLMTEQVMWMNVLE